MSFFTMSFVSCLIEKQRSSFAAFHQILSWFTPAYVTVSLTLMVKQRVQEPWIDIIVYYFLLLFLK